MFPVIENLARNTASFSQNTAVRLAVRAVAKWRLSSVLTAGSTKFRARLRVVRRSKKKDESSPAKRGCSKESPMQKQRGFSLIELLIVVAIILIIASIAIPNLLAARRQAHEAAAAEAIRTINTAQISYSSAYPTVGFASTLSALGGTTCTPPSSSSA